MASLAITTFGFSGMMAVFTFIQPLLTRVAGFGTQAVSPILLLFGAGLVAGNVVGGRMADRRLNPTLIGTLAALTVVVGLIGSAMQAWPTALLFVFLLGVASFATVAPLQLTVLQRAGAAGQALASSLNIAAFNLANAIGAWIGAVIVGHGGRLAEIPRAACIVTAVGLVLAMLDAALSRRRESLRWLSSVPPNRNRTDPAIPPAQASSTRRVSGANALIGVQGRSPWPSPIRHDERPVGRGCEPPLHGHEST